MTDAAPFRPSSPRIAPLTLDDAQRIQVLFRPEDVVLACAARELAAPPLGCGEVEQVTFGGSFERLRLRLPPIPGVRPLAPPVAYGGSALFRGLAALPVLPFVPDAGQLQVVHLDDVVATILWFLRPDAPARIELELAGPQRLAFDEVVASFRQWLGWKAARRVSLPRWLMLACTGLATLPAGSAGGRR